MASREFGTRDLGMLGGGRTCLLSRLLAKFLDDLVTETCRAQSYLQHYTSVAEANVGVVSERFATFNLRIFY